MVQIIICKQWNLRKNLIKVEHLVTSTMNFGDIYYSNGQMIEKSKQSI
jgi:hypothetical protein